MFAYKQFFPQLLTEMYYGKTHTEEELPDNRPYGFMVYPDGTFGIAHSMMSHDDLVGGASGITRNMNLGGVRVVISADEEKNEYYYMEYLPNKATSRAVKTAKDLSDWYGMEHVFAKYDANQENF